MSVVLILYYFLLNLIMGKSLIDDLNIYELGFVVSIKMIVVCYFDGVLLHGNFVLNVGILLDTIISIVMSSSILVVMVVGYC